MMTDKPTSKNSDSSTDKANTTTKSTPKSSESSPEKGSQTNVSVDMSNSTNAVKTSDVEKNTPNKSNKKTPKTTEAIKPSPSAKSSASPKDKSMMKSKSPQTKAPEQKAKTSKLAILSLLAALIAIVGIVLLYFWHIQQQTEIISQLQQIKLDATKSNQLAQERMQEKMFRTLQAQEKNLAMQFSDSANNMKEATQENIEQLNLMVEKFSQNQPTDWLVHESEYLIRIAARTLWLEKDTAAAVGLLQDADARIAELNDPEILPIRQLIYQDIEALRAIPKLETEQVILSLMALGEQIQSLPLVTLTVPQEAENADRFTLSEDIADWRQNIGKTWDRFMQTFVVVHSRVGDLEPILPVEQRQHLKENLNLKLQIAQWAASKGNHKLFIQSLDDAESWLTQYFDLNDEKNKAFISTIENVKNKVIVIEDDVKLISLQAIRKALANKKSTLPPVQTIENKAPSEELLEEVKDAQQTVEDSQSVVTPEASPEVMPEIIEEQQPEQTPEIKEAEIKEPSKKAADMSEAA